MANPILMEKILMTTMNGMVGIFFEFAWWVLIQYLAVKENKSFNPQIQEIEHLLLD